MTEGRRKDYFCPFCLRKIKLKIRKTDKNYLSSPGLINILDEQFRTNVKVMTVSQ